jgi:hypothetical protein
MLRSQVCMLVWEPFIMTDLSFVISSLQMAECCCHHLRFIIRIHLSHFPLCNLCTCGSSASLVQLYISNEVKYRWLRCILLNTGVDFWYHESTNLFIVFIIMKVGERNINSRVCMYVPLKFCFWSSKSIPLSHIIG